MNNSPTQIRDLTYQWLIVLFCVLTLTGCSVKLISSYDERTDQNVTALQKKVATFFVKVGSQVGLPECKYDNHVNFYQETKVDISAIEMRARAIPKNEITIEQVQLLKSSLNSLEQLHQLDCFTENQVINLQSNFDTHLTAILKLELAKKRGD